MADNDGPDQYGVVLYYKYTPIPDVDQLFSFYDSNCNSLGLLGRVRLAPDGVNVTVFSYFPSLSLTFPPFLLGFWENGTKGNVALRF